ncbi:MAG: ABC transporter permease subunit [Anaerolineales bacterium]|nr:ABC transporter permease subunit [Anaerolineales bacterium]
MFRLLLQELKFRRGATLWWGLGLCFFPLVYIAIYPSVAEEMANLADLEIYQAMGVSMGTFADFVGSILLVFLPLVAAIYAIINGTATLAGEEEDGRLEMVVTLPLPRWKIVAAKALALSISSFLIITIVALCSLSVLQGLKEDIVTDLTGTELFIAVLYTWPLVFAVAMLSMFLASFCPRRRIASIIAAAILVVSYFGSNLAASTKVLEPFEPFFLFTYLDGSGAAIANGQSIHDVLILLGIGAVSLALSVGFFQRRKLTVGVWPWQRGRIEAE